MAAINLGLPDTNDPNYTHVPGVDTHGFREVAANNREASRNNAFEGLTKLIANGVKSVDNTIQSSAREDLYKGVDERRGAQGVDAAVDSEEYNPLAANKPADTAAIKTGLERVQAAFDQGKISDSHYYAQLESMVRSVRSRYPGYREQIDSMVHSITGITPANALRQSLLHDMNVADSAKSKEKDQFKSFVLKESNIGHIPSDYWTNPERYSESEIYSIVGKAKATEEKMKSDMSDLDYKIKQGNATKQDIENTANKGMTGITTGILNEIRPAINELQEKQTRGEELTPQDQDLLKAKARDLRLKAMTAVNNYFSQEGLMTIDPNKRKQLTDQAMEIVDVFDKAITDKDTGLLNTAYNHVQAMTNSDTAATLRNYPTIRAVNTLGNMKGGADFFKDQIAASDSPLGIKLREETKALLTGIRLNNLTGGRDSPNGSISVPQQLDHLRNSPDGKNPGAWREFLNNWTSDLSNPATPQEARLNDAKIMFAKDNLNFLDNFKGYNSKLQAYVQLTSPSITEQMVKFKGTETWDNYSHWVKNSFAGVYKGAMDDIADTPNRPWIAVRFNESSNRFEAYPTEEGIKQAGISGRQSLGFSVLQQLERLNGENISKSVDQLNRGIANIEPVLKADGFDTKDEIYKLTKFLSLTDKKNDTTWQWLLKGMKPKPEIDSKGKQESSFGGEHPNFTQSSGDNTPRGTTNLVDLFNRGGPAPVMETIARGESDSNYNRLVDTPTHPKEAPLTDMTVGEVLKYQKSMLDAGNKSSAAGKYQIVSKTLRGLIRRGVISMDDKFNEDTQDRAAQSLLEARGYQEYLDGKKPLYELLRGLGDEWEILKVSPSLRKKVATELAQMRR